jgi:hypothetical protein
MAASPSSVVSSGEKLMSAGSSYAPFGIVWSLDGLERDSELADVVFVALEFALEVGVVAGEPEVLPVPLHRGQDLGLGQAVLARQKREDEAEQPLLDRNLDGILERHESILCWWRDRCRRPRGVAPITTSG